MLDRPTGGFSLHDALLACSYRPNIVETSRNSTRGPVRKGELETDRFVCGTTEIGRPSRSADFGHGNRGRSKCHRGSLDTSSAAGKQHLGVPSVIAVQNDGRQRRARAGYLGIGHGKDPSRRTGNLFVSCQKAIKMLAAAGARVDDLNDSRACHTWIGPSSSTVGNSIAAATAHSTAKQIITDSAIHAESYIICQPRGTAARSCGWRRILAGSGLDVVRVRGPHG